MKEFFCLVSWSFCFESFGFRKLGILNRNGWWNPQQMWRDYKICEQGTPLSWTLSCRLHIPSPKDWFPFVFSILNPERGRSMPVSALTTIKWIILSDVSFPSQIQRRLNAKNCGDTDKMKGIPITFIRTYLKQKRSSSHGQSSFLNNTSDCRCPGGLRSVYG